MHLQVVSCDYHSADLNVRERLAFPTEKLEQAYGMLRDRFPETELVVLSTCNRVEVYAAHEQLQLAPSHQELAQFLSEFHRIPLGDFAAELLERTGPDVVRHLFQVAASVDSMVLGEPQIVAQVRDAYRTAQVHQVSGPVTSQLFERALNVSKRVRTETKLSEGRVSIASVAVSEFGKSIFDHFGDKLVLVLGAGTMAEETLRYLQEEGARQIVVANRTQERAELLAEAFQGKAVPWDQLDRWLAAADVIVSTTGADRPIVDLPRFRQARRQSPGRPVFILDLGAPRDFSPEVGRLDENVFLYSIDDLQQICDKNRASRQREVERALTIIDQETDAFMAGLSHLATGPIIKRLREQWREIVELESSRLFKKLPHLEQDRPEIERTIERMVNKLLHPPLEALRHEARAGTPHGLLDALKRLFGLG